MTTKIALIDCNSFFCSCERLFSPILKNKPIIVLSNNDGCVVSMTPEVKRLGIKVGMPYFKIKKECEKHKITIFSSNYALYTDMSRRVMDVLKNFSPEMEIYSVDEAWLDLSHIKDYQIEECGRLIKASVEKKTGIPVSIGIAPTKTLAKIANYVSKKENKSGVLNLLSFSEQTQVLKNLPVKDIWGIGEGSEKKLHLLGIRTALQYRDFENKNLLDKSLGVLGIQKQLELRAMSCFKINQRNQVRQSITCSRSFGKNIYSRESLNEAISSYISSAAQKLRSEELLAGSLGVYIRTNRFSDDIQYSSYDEIKISTPTSDTRELIKLAINLLGKIYRDGYGYKKAGVYINEVFHENNYQLSLFEQGNSDEKSKRLMNTMDKINFFYGPETIKSAACGGGYKDWRSLKELGSMRVTTSWNELQKVK